MESFKILSVVNAKSVGDKKYVKVNYIKANGKEKEKNVKLKELKNNECRIKLEGVRVNMKKNKDNTYSNFVANFVEVIGTKTDEEGKIKVNKKDFSKTKHPKYEMIETCIKSNIPVFLSGPAGAGKNYTLEQIANNNGWDFFFSNSVQDEFKLTGFIDAKGEYQETEFYKACTSENECIFFLDEIDASTPEVLVLLNAAIANGYFSFPNKRVDFGKNKVHFVAAGNTVGNGANDMYTGRQQLDQATLDRFAIIEFDYAKNIEKLITNNNDELIDFIRELRKIAKDNFTKTTFSYRCMEMVTKLEKTQMDLRDILKISVFKGLDQDTINTFKMSDKLYETNEYAKVLNNDLVK